MNAALTNRERAEAMRQRRRAAGLARLELYAHPDDHEAIKAAALRLQRKRMKATKEGKTPPASG